MINLLFVIFLKFESLAQFADFKIVLKFTPSYKADDVMPKENYEAGIYCCW